MKVTISSVILLFCSISLMAQQEKISFTYDSFGYKMAAQRRFVELLLTRRRQPPLRTVNKPVAKQIQDRGFSFHFYTHIGVEKPNIQMWG